MSTSYGHDQDAEPPTPDGEEPGIVESDDTSGESSASQDTADQDAEPPDARDG